MAKSVSTEDYSAATQMARIIVAVLYFLAGLLVAISLRGLDHPGRWFIPGLLGAVLACNVVVWMFQKISLPKIQAQLAAAIAERDGPGFARHIVRREMAAIIQPIGGVALTIGLVGTVIVLRQWH